MTDCFRVLVIFWLISSIPHESDGECFVHPTALAVIVGARVSLTCSTNQGFSVSSWQKGKDATTKITVYAAPVYKSDGTIRTPQSLADGYFVIHPADNETTLHINKTSLSHAGIYVCTCDDPSKSTNTANVVVLEAEPKFSTDGSITDGKHINFSCSISFNASSDVSCELTIENAYGKITNRDNIVTVKNNLTVCNLEHRIIANASFDQPYTCNATLITKGYIIYSRVLNASVEAQPVTTPTASLSSVPQPTTNETNISGLAIGLSVPIAIIAILVAIVVYIILRSKKRNSRVIRQHCMGQPAQQAVHYCSQTPGNRYDKNNSGNQIAKDIAPVTYSHQAIAPEKSLTGNDLTVCENELYDSSPRHLDP